MQLPKVTYCMVVLNRLNEMKVALERVSPYVDKTIVLDGGSTDGTVEWLQSSEAKVLQIEMISNKQVRLPYGNHTPDERNRYLQAAGTDGWILVTDSDEWLDQRACPVLKKMAYDAEANGVNIIGFQAHDYWTYETGEIYDNKSNYWNPTFFKACPNMYYAGHTHSHIVRPGLKDVLWNSPFEYLHVKSEASMWRNSTFLYWTTARVADNVTNDPVWLDFHSIMASHGYKDWHEFNRVMEVGCLPEDIKDWFIKYKDSENPEMCAWFIHYFIFKHPEENINKISCERHSRYTYDYIEKCKRDCYDK